MSKETFNMPVVGDVKLPGTEAPVSCLCEISKNIVAAGCGNKVFVCDIVKSSVVEQLKFSDLVTTVCCYQHYFVVGSGEIVTVFDFEDKYKKISSFSPQGSSSDKKIGVVFGAEGLGIIVTTYDRWYLHLPNGEQKCLLEDGNLYHTERIVALRSIGLPSKIFWMISGTRGLEKIEVSADSITFLTEMRKSNKQFKAFKCLDTDFANLYLAGSSTIFVWDPKSSADSVGKIYQHPTKITDVRCFQFDGIGMILSCDESGGAKVYSLISNVVVHEFKEKSSIQTLLVSTKNVIISQPGRLIVREFPRYRKIVIEKFCERFVCSNENIPSKNAIMIKFSNEQTQEIVLHIASRVPVLRNLVESGKFEHPKTYTQPFYPVIDKVNTWLIGKFPSFEDVSVLKHTYIIAVEWEMTQLAYYIAKNLPKIFPEVRKIIDLMFDLRDRETSGLYLSCQVILKESHKDVVTKHGGYVMSKGDCEYSKNMVVHVIGELVYQNLPKLERCKEFLNKIEGYDHEKEYRKHVAKLLFDDVTANVVFQTLDKKIVKAHREILIEHEYFRGLLCGKFAETKGKVIFLNVDLFVFSCILNFVYREELPFIGISDKNLFLLLSVSEKFQIEKMVEMVKKEVSVRLKRENPLETVGLLREENFKLKKQLADAEIENMDLRYENFLFREKNSNNSQKET